MEAKKKAHRERKNGASREAWKKAKAAKNTARGHQVYLTGSTEHGVLPGWARMVVETSK